MVGSFCHKELLALSQALAKRMLVDQMFIGQPQQAEHVGIAFGKKPDVLAHLVANNVPFADESLFDVVAAKSDVMLDRSNEDTHEIAVIYAVRVRGGNVHVVGNAAAVAQQNDAIRQ